VLGLLIDKLATLRVDLLPGFFTADYMHQEAFAVPIIIRQFSKPPALPVRLEKAMPFLR
jgi:hypothetical protein